MRDEEDDRISADSYLEHDREAFESTMIDRVEGAKFFKLDSAKTRYVDIIPYTVGEGNPMADKGSRYFVRNYWAHRGIGPDGKGSEICHAATFGEPCAICTEADRLLAEGDIDLDTHKKLKRPSKRQLYHVIDTQDPEGSVQIWDVSHFFFGKALNEALSAAAEDEEDNDYKYFASLKGGYTLKLLIEEDKFQGRSTYKVKRIDFKPRKKNYSSKILAQTHCLDDLIKRRTYKEIKKAFLQTSEESDADSRSSSTKKGNRDMAKKKPTTKKQPTKPTKPTKAATATKQKSAKPKIVFNKGDKVDADDLGICKVLKVSDDGKLLALKDSDGDVHRNVSVLDVSPITEKPAKAAPKKAVTKPTPKKKPKPVVEDEEDSELEDEEDSELEDEEDSELEDEEDSELEDEEDSELEDEEDEEDSELEDEEDSELEDEEDEEFDEEDSELEDEED